MADANASNADTEATWDQAKRTFVAVSAMGGFVFAAHKGWIPTWAGALGAVAGIVYLAAGPDARKQAMEDTTHLLAQTFPGRFQHQYGQGVDHYQVAIVDVEEWGTLDSIAEAVEGEHPDFDLQVVHVLDVEEPSIESPGLARVSILPRRAA